MGQLAELVFIFILGALSGFPEGSVFYSPAYSLTAFIISLTALSFENRISDYTASFLFTVLCFFYPPLTVYTPMAAYSVSGRSMIPIIPLPLTLIPVILKGDFFIPVLFLLSVWMSYKSRIRVKLGNEIIRLKDTLRENEILTSRIKKEEEKNQESRVEIALLNERNRISREIHDSVGHTITASLLQTEALKTVAGENLSPMLDKMSQNLNRGMDEIRKTLQGIHSQSLDLERRILSLTEGPGEKYSVDLTFQAGDELPPEYRIAAERFIKEALTNIRKHSDGDSVHIVIRELPSHYTFSVKDNGSEKKGPIKKGLGLMGMEETAAEYGGIFTSGYQKGFFVHMTLPRRDENE